MNRKIFSAMILVVILIFTGCSSGANKDIKASNSVGKKLSKEDKELLDRETAINDKYKMNTDTRGAEELYNEGMGTINDLNSLFSSNSIQYNQVAEPFNPKSTKWFVSTGAFIKVPDISPEVNYSLNYFCSYRQEDWSTYYDFYLSIPEGKYDKNFVFDFNKFPVLKEVLLKKFGQDFIDFMNYKINYGIKDVFKTEGDKLFSTDSKFAVTDSFVSKEKGKPLAINMHIKTGYGNSEGSENYKKSVLIPEAELSNMTQDLNYEDAKKTVIVVQNGIKKVYEKNNLNPEPIDSREEVKEGSNSFVSKLHINSSSQGSDLQVSYNTSGSSEPWRDFWFVDTELNIRAQKDFNFNISDYPAFVESIKLKYSDNYVTFLEKEIQESIKKASNEGRLYNREEEYKVGIGSSFPNFSVVVNPANGAIDLYCSVDLGRGKMAK